MLVGTSYYPEISPEAEWRRDLSAMKACGLRVLRVGEFAWTAWEPAEGRLDFGWSDRFVDLAGQMGFSVILCTPTATPPPWLTTQYPEVMIERRDGTRHYAGGRRDVDVDSEVLRHYTVDIARALGARYGRHPAVIGWQLDNELIGPEGEPPESHSRATTFRFRQYLKAVHGDLATLNARWGTRFWSQEYSDWGEVGTPRNARSTMGQVLDYSRYFSRSLGEYLRLQRDALREVISPDQWIGHNSTAVFDRGLDHQGWAADTLDVAGWDAYRGAAGGPYPAVSSALAHDLFRSARHRPFWVFETSAADARLPRSYLGEMAARGARACVLWHWREHRSGPENLSNTVCDHAGRPDPERLAFLSRASADFDPPGVAGDDADRGQGEGPDLPKRRVALLYCPDCVRVHLTPDPYLGRGLAARLPYLRVLFETYRVLWQRGVAVDVARPGQALDDYAMVVAPSPRLLAKEHAERVCDFVRGGGTLLLVAKAAHQDQWGAYYPAPGGPLSEASGYVVPRDLQLPATTEGLEVSGLRGGVHACLPHVDRVELVGAEPIARFTAGPLKGEPAAVTHRLGAGATYSALGLSPGLIGEVVEAAARRAGVNVHSGLGEEVGLMPDLFGRGLWVFNHGATAVQCAGRTVGPEDCALVPM